MNKEIYPNPIAAREGQRWIYHAGYIFANEPVASFYGEELYKCPLCGRNFEINDAEFERDGFQKIARNVFRCPCGKLLNIV